MDKNQADAIAQAILEPDQRVQEQLRTKRALEAADNARKRRVAMLGLAGCAVGAVIAYLTGARFPVGVLWGGLAGSAIGWLVTSRAAV